MRLIQLHFSKSVLNNTPSDIQPSTNTTLQKAYKPINKINEEDFKRAAREANEKARIETYTLLKSGKVRMVPGNLKHNVALERVFFKDLIKLSRERYSTKKETDWLKNNFLISQAKKGID